MIHVEEVVLTPGRSPQTQMPCLEPWLYCNHGLRGQLVLLPGGPTHAPGMAWALCRNDPAETIKAALLSTGICSLASISQTVVEFAVGTTDIQGVNQ